LIPVQLVGKLASPKGWVRDTAQQLLVERAHPDVIAPLKTQALNSPNPLAQIHSLWTLEGMGQIDRATLISAFGAKSPKVRAMAIRISEPFLRAYPAEFLGELTTLARTDLDPDVQRQLAFSFGQSPAPEAKTGLMIIAKNPVANPLTREAILSSLAAHELHFLNSLLADQDWKAQKDGRSELLASLAQCILNERKTNHIAQTLDAAASASGWQRLAILDGLNSKIITLKGKTASRPKLVYFGSKPAGFARLEKSNDKTMGDRLQRLSRVITWPGQPGYVAPPVITPLRAEEQARYDAGQKLFSETCAACHQLSGLGQTGLAPPLADSEWVLGSEQRLGRIVLHGLHGSIHVEGRSYDLEMPSFSMFTDEQIAGVLTYIRREWEHGASPVKAATVKSIRLATQKRDEAWSEGELLKIN
jgi:mono/diheme cytochrome c family protein